MRKIVFTVIALMAATVPSRAQSSEPAKSSIAELSDSALIQELAKGDPEAPSQFALYSRTEIFVHEVFVRGERMIPLLKALEGDTRRYRGGGLTVEISDEEFIGDVTVEVVGIYLVCAIYEGKMPFAMSPALKRTDPSTTHLRVNSPGNVHRAWISIHRWAAQFNTIGLAALRKQGVDPLTGSGVSF